MPQTHTKTLKCPKSIWAVLILSHRVSELFSNYSFQNKFWLLFRVLKAESVQIVDFKPKSSKRVSSDTLPCSGRDRFGVLSCILTFLAVSELFLLILKRFEVTNQDNCNSSTPPFGRFWLETRGGGRWLVSEFRFWIMARKSQNRRACGAKNLKNEIFCKRFPL